MSIILKTTSYITVVILLALQSACTTIPEEFNNTNSLTAQDVLDGTALLGDTIKSSDLPDDNIMKVTEEMEDFLQKYVLKANGPKRRAELLTQALFDENKLNLAYESSQTYSAREAFNNKVANCIAFSLLYVSLAERLGLDATFQEILILPEWGTADDGTYIESRHVNVDLYMHGIGRWVVDIDSIGRNLALRATPLEMEHVEALYYGNIASELMLKKRYKDAFRYFVKAIKLKPSEASTWSNLGVLYRRNGLDDYAERAYFTALEYDPKNASAFNNLAYLYKESGNNKASEYYEKLASSSQSKNPYYRYLKAKKALEKNQFELAMKHIDYAIRRNKLEPLFYEFKSSVHAMLGERNKSAKALKTAKQLRTEVS